MLYTACFREAEKYPGEKYVISRTKPNGCTYPTAKYLMPDWDMVQGIKQQEITEAQYTARYRQILEGSCGCSRSAQEPHLVKDHLQAIKAMVEQGRDIVLLCYCGPGKFCHRVLIARYLIDELGLDEGLVEIH